MNVFEMEGFLRGKCVPGDMKFNETNAQYLVRKTGMTNSQLRSLDELAGQFLQMSTDSKGRAATAYAECADLLAKAVRNIRSGE